MCCYVRHGIPATCGTAAALPAFASQCDQLEEFPQAVTHGQLMAETCHSLLLHRLLLSNRDR